jgi:hypothetical protein
MPKYKVTVSQTWSETVVVTAKNAQEAKMKGWKKYNPKKMNHTINAEKA